MGPTTSAGGDVAAAVVGGQVYEVDGGQPEDADELDAEITREGLLPADHDQAAVHRQ
jgi:hypothetical protein